MKRKTDQRAREADTAIIVEPCRMTTAGAGSRAFRRSQAATATAKRAWEAREDALAAIEEWKDAARRLMREIPGPGALGQWRQRVPKTLHDKLRRLAAAEGVSLNQLVASRLAEAVAKRAA